MCQRKNSSENAGIESESEVEEKVRIVTHVKKMRMKSQL